MTFEPEHMTERGGTVHIKFSHPLAMNAPEKVRSLGWDEFERSLYLNLKGSSRLLPEDVFTWLYTNGYRPTKLFGGDLYIEPDE